MDSPLQVILAGMNVDIEGLNEIKSILSGGYTDSNARWNASNLLSKLTPETIAASYARISRDPRIIPELRRMARQEVERARTTNQNLIFTMGHKSIAEHVFFNFDIMGLSRRAVEELERKRLQSYTEKSQRYITLNGDFVIPPEIQGTPMEKEFLALVEKQNKFYNDNLETLIQWHIKQNPEVDLTNKSNKDRLEGYGKEDARYALSMATQAQIGLSLSARNLESLISELRSSESEEVKNLGQKLFEEIEEIAPSVIKYTESNNYFSKTRKELKEYVEWIIKKDKFEFKKRPVHTSGGLCSKDVELFTHLERDDSIPAGIIFSSSDLPFDSCLRLVDSMKLEEKKELLKKADAYQEKHDPKLREYELGDRVAEIEISSSGFAQLKRHRMNTLISQRYQCASTYGVTGLNITIPESISSTSLQQDLLNIALDSSQFQKKLRYQVGVPEIVSEYILTNAHKRRVLLDANNRQIYAICAERESEAAQWDIRNISNQLHDLIQQESPLTTAYLCGKDKFDKLKGKRYP